MSKIATLFIICFCACGVDKDEQGPDANVGDFCADEASGSGVTATPVASGQFSFTTSLVSCSISTAEAATCIGATHESMETTSNGQRILSSNGVPNHDIGIFPNAGNPNTITSQNKNYSVATAPTKTQTAKTPRVIGAALNGIKFEPETAERFRNTQWRYEALTFTGRVSDDPMQMGNSLGFDCNFAHVQPNGEYHYHGVPTALMPQEQKIVQVGWAADGFPILARYGYQTPGDTGSAIVELSTSFRVKVGARQPIGAGDTPSGDYDGTFIQDWEYVQGMGDLDECNGRDETIEIDGTSYSYAYYLTHQYPFMPRCVWGTVGTGFN